MPRKKDQQFLIRADEHDASIIRQKVAASGLSQQDYLLKATLGANITDPTPFRELLTEYKKQGTNLNQLTRAVNAGYDASTEMINIMAEMEKERQKLWQLLKQFTQMQA